MVGISSAISDLAAESRSNHCVYIRLIAHHREREGLEVLQKLHVRPGDTSDIAAKEEYYQIRKQIELENQTGVTSFMGMLKRKSYRKRIYVGCLVQYVLRKLRILDR